MQPERRILRERLGLEDVERRAVQGPIIETRDDVGLDLQSAAPGIDENRAAEAAIARKTREQLPVEDAARLRRERKQADEDVGTGQEGIELIAPRVRLQPATSKPISESFRPASWPRTPIPMTPTRTSRAGGGGRSSSQILARCRES
jgi:hypothetical protein